MGKLKPIELFIYETNESLGVFNSAKYLEDNSEILFGKKISSSRLNQTTRDRNQAYGMYVKFISQEEYINRKHDENNISLIYKIKEKELKEKPSDKWIDYSNFPKKIQNGKESVDWINSKGVTFVVHYKDLEKEFYIEEVCRNKEKGQTILTLKYDNKLREITTSEVISVSFGDILGVSKNNGRYVNEFKYNIGDIIDDIQIIDRKIIVHRNKKERMYKYKCLKCGYECDGGYDNVHKKFIEETWTIERDITKGHRCSCCGHRIVSKYINSAYAYDKNICNFLLYEEDAYKYSNGSGKKILFKCPKCGNVKYSDMHSFFAKGFSCPKCGDNISYPNKFMFNILKQLNIRFETEYCPKWINPKKYDFFLYDYNIIIEMDGAFHYITNKIANRTKEESIGIDNYKDITALKNGVYVIRIDCNYYTCNHKTRFEYVKNNILNSPLNLILNLYDVDWDACNNTAMKNTLIEEVCKIKSENPNIQIKEIRKMFLPERKLTNGTIIEYLKIGNELGLCYYKPNENIYFTEDNMVGVVYNKNRNKWIASIGVNNTRKNKSFKTKEEAIQQRLEWEKEREEIYAKQKQNQTN